ncbi:response regulator [Halobacteriovorax vibrionivorans]|uniref:histidine kinase n=1 Tax=Halobacteriovorax vibrionivorans TaxID=2152716 RepID=A0ABY0IER6_9BACT|nr:ATP-binding protein [Halobacteriovorax vibrionivorans]RZF21456.1 response regulator [Halobacteriovorax vibrionivorans]
MSKTNLTEFKEKRVDLFNSLKIFNEPIIETFDSILETVAILVKCPIGFISIDNTRDQIITSSFGVNSKKLKVSDSLFLNTAKGFDPLIIEDIENDERFSMKAQRIDNENYRFYAGFPLIVKGKYVLGALSLYDKEPRKLTENEVRLASNLVKGISQYIEMSSELTISNKFSIMMEEIQSLNVGVRGNPFDHFQKFLEKGTAVLDLEYGIISHIQDGIYKVIEVTGPDEQITVGFEAEVENTYCAEVLSRKETVVFSNVDMHPKMCSHPVYVNMKLESYIGAPIIVKGKVFGTLNYSSRIIRKSGFSKEEVKFVEILSQLIAKKIETWQAVEEKQEAFEELQNSFNRFQTLAELLPVGVFLTSADGLAKYQNKRWLDYAGMNKEEALGEGWVQAIDSNQREEVAKKWAEAALNEEEFYLNIDFCNVETGEVTRTKTIATPLRNRGGSTAGHIGVNLDMTKQVEYERSLREATKDAQEASKAKSLFLANMSHEIRTPLNSIVGYADLLANSPLPAEYIQYASTLRSSSEVLLNLVNDILDISKIEASAISIDDRNFSLVELLEGVMDIFAWPAKEKGLELSYNIEDGVEEYFIGDSTRITQVLINLIGNAIKFTQEGSVRVVIKENSSDLPGNIHFSVTDSGIGIPDEVSESIFNAFDQGEKSTTHQHGGTGLGLAITKELVELMGGAIHVSSKVGIGSQFQITLNLKKGSIGPQQSSKHKKEDELPTKLEKTKKLKILLVDDAINNRNLINVYLKNENFDIVEAENGQEAFYLFKYEADFDLIFMDLQMPVLDGFEAIKKIRQLEEDKKRVRTPIIALTAFALKEDMDRCFEIGCDEYLTKPVKKNSVLEAIDKILNKNGKL